MRGLRWIGLGLWGACIGVAAPCFLMVIVLTIVQHAQSDVPSKNRVFEQDGAYFRRSTGGDPDKRPRYRITREQFEVYRHYEERARSWARTGTPFGLAFFVLTVILFGNSRPPKLYPARVYWGGLLFAAGTCLFLLGMWKLLTRR